MITVVNRKFTSKFLKFLKIASFWPEPTTSNIKLTMTSHSCKEFITQKYGKKTYSNIISYQEKTRHLKLLQQDIKFLNNCKKSNIVPVHCKLGDRRDASPTTDRLLRNTERKLLNRSIAKCYSNRWKANKILQNSINQLEDTLSIIDYCKLIIFTEKKIKSRVERKLETLDKKYQMLINKSRPPLNDLSEEDIKVHKENTVRNLSTVEIPEQFIDVLSKGIDYKIATRNIPVFDIIAGIEDALPTINISNAFRFDCCNILKKSRNKSETNIIEKVCRNINKWLNNNDLCLLEADKGRATCIISRKQVHEMVAQELNKPERYRKPKADTIKQSRATINKKLAELKLKDLITKQEHPSLKPNVPKTPKARPILKIHQDPLKIRLIINTQNSPIYKIAKKISKELRPLIRSGKSLWTNELVFKLSITKCFFILDFNNFV